MTARARAVPCPQCHAPVGAPCADLRTYDGNLYGARVHRSRERRYVAGWHAELWTGVPCPNCGALVGEPCHPSKMSGSVNCQDRPQKPTEWAPYATH